METIINLFIFGLEYYGSIQVGWWTGHSSKSKSSPSRKFYLLLISTFDLYHCKASDNSLKQEKGCELAIVIIFKVCTNFVSKLACT